jgi:hypothetical protein
MRLCKGADLNARSYTVYRWTGDEIARLMSCVSPIMGPAGRLCNN